MLKRIFPGAAFTAILTINAFVLFAASLPSTAQMSGDYTSAEALIRAKEWDKGITVLQLLLKSEPQNLKALNLLGIAWTGKGELIKANAEFKRILELKPGFVPALKNLAINEFTLNDFATSERHFLDASDLAPKDVVVHAYLSQIAYRRKDYRNAAKHGSQSVELLAHDPNALSTLAVSYLETRQVSSALALLQKLDLERLSLRSQFEVGLALARRDRYKEAVPFFYSVHSHVPESYDAGFDLAFCYLESKQYAQAIEPLARLAETGHKTAELENLLAEAYEGNGQTKEATDALRAATLLAPEDEDNYLDLSALCAKHDAYDIGLEVIAVGLHYIPHSDRLVLERGILHAMKNQFELAEQDFQEAARLAPEKSFSYVGMGVGYMQSGDLAKAVEVLRQRVKQTQGDYLLHYMLGEALLRSGANPGDTTFPEARAALETSITLNPNFSGSRVEWAKILLKENRVDDAVVQLEKARALDPKNQAAYSQLAIAYRRQGKTKLAKQMLDSLRAINEEERNSVRKATRIVRESSQEQGSTPSSNAADPAKRISSPPGP